MQKCEHICGDLCILYVLKSLKPLYFIAMSTALIKRLYHSSDVTCVKFLGDYVLAGVGGILKIFRVERGKCIKEIEIFKSHRIHGIQVHENKNIMIFGAKEVAVISLTLTENEIAWNIDAFLGLEDWILHTHWVTKGKDIAIITAHNVVWLWPWLKNPQVVKPIKCTEKCILYSASMCGSVCEESMVFAGTVFREIVLWMPNEKLVCDQPVLHRLKGHNGVIFSISWDWNSSLICSTSDDRSVRTWKVNFSIENNWRSATVVPFQAYYGHTARVWRSLILRDTVVSCGEDSQICVWNSCGALLKKWDRNTSGCIWSLDYSEKHKLLVVGSGDGSIQLFPLTVPVLISIATSIILPEYLNPRSESIRKLCLLGSGSTIVVTESGTLFSLSRELNSWKVIGQDGRFSNYCILSVSSDKTLFSLASLKGYVCVYQDSNMTRRLDKKIENGKIWALLWLSKDEFLVCGDEGRLTVWEMFQDCDKPEIKCKACFTLPRARERWPTAAATIQVDNMYYLICGDRCGSLHLYKYEDSVKKVYTLPCHSLFKIHGNLGVTSIYEFEKELLSAGRDGTLRHYRVEDSRLYPSSCRKAAMDWLAKTLVCHLVQPRLLIVGFKEKNMTFWCPKKRSIMLEVDCGGGHRSWDTCMLNDEVLQIAFIRDKQVFAGYWNIIDIVQPTLLHGILANEINCILHLSSCPTAIAFGGEDGTVLITQFSSNLSFLKHTVALTSHISSIRCLIKHENLFISAGGRAQLKAWRLEPGEMRESSYTELASFMLKGDRPQNSQAGPGVPLMDPEMRFMDLCCISLGSDDLLLVTGCSDGAMRVIAFDTSSCSFTLIGESVFHGRCILKVTNINLSSGRVMIISAATDGILALWDANTFLKPDVTYNPFWSKRFHKSGINSVHVSSLQNCDKPLVLIASGGDDNALTMCVLQIEETCSSVSVLAEWQSSSAHAAQITGVWILGDLLISTSIDQRLTVWQWNLRTSAPISLHCTFICQCMCHVSDIQDMYIWEESHGFVICVAGKGVEILQLNLKEIGEVEDS